MNERAIAPQEKTQLETLKNMFERSKPNMAAVIPKHLSVDRLIKVALFAASKNPVLLQCEKTSIWRCVLQSAQLGLEPDGPLGAAYMVPYRNNKSGQYEAQFIIGYRGLVTLARRSGEIESIEAHVVYEKDKFRCVLGLNPILEHEPTFESETGKPVAVYAIAKLKGGGAQWEMMTRAQVEEIRKRSRAGQSGPWVSDWSEMAKKGLHIETNIPTRDGWKKMKDISVGDVLFDMDGQQTKVIDVSEVKNLPCYRITFSNREQIICDDEHLWVCRIGAGKAYKKPYEVFGIKQMYDAFIDGMPITIPVQSALEIEDAELPIDPYIFGYWIGNGNSRGPKLTCHNDDIEDIVTQIERAGYTIGTISKDSENCSNISMVNGVIEKMREMGVIQNKHIPQIYLRASIAQRRALLQGLIDSDGCVDKERGRATFCSTKVHITNAVHELVCSLGETPHRVTRRAQGFGVETIAHTVGWKPSFTCSRLTRKIARIQERVLCKYRSIRTIEKMYSVPTKCIAVDSDTKTYLAGDSMIVTHNTVVRRLAKYLPLSVELAKAVEHDEHIDANTGEITTLDVEASEVALIEETVPESPESPARPQSKADLLTSKI